MIRIDEDQKENQSQESEEKAFLIFQSFQRKTSVVYDV